MRLPVASLTLSELLGGAFRLALPAYQRPYSWTRREAEQLLDDLLMACGLDHAGEAEPDYFLGTLLLLDPERLGFSSVPDGASRRLEIIDGQQRLVTLTILACVMRDLSAEQSPELARTLDALVAAPADGGSGHAGTAEARPGNRLVLGGSDGAFLEHYIQHADACRLMPPDDELSVGQERLLSVREGFLARLADMPLADVRRLVAYMLEQCHFVVALSHDIDHAHRMFTVLNERGRPLARNDILKAELMRSLPAERVEALVQRWDRAAEAIGADFEQFFSHVRTICGETRAPILVAVRRIVDGAGGAEVFLDRVFDPLSRAYRTATEAAVRDGLVSGQATRHLVSLSRLTSGDWMPAAMLALTLYEDDRETGERLLAEIDRLAYLLRLLCYGSGRRATRFAAVAAAIRSGEALAPGSGVFDLTREELRQVAHNLKDLHRRNPSHCKLALLRLVEEEQDDLLRVDPAGLSVEHVLPQRPRAGSDWRRMFPDPAIRERSTNSLGNLVIIGARQNERARNKDFRRKQEVYADTAGEGWLAGSLKDVLDAPVWDQGRIEAREARLLAVAERVWRIDLARAGKDRAIAGGDGWTTLPVQLAWRR